MDTLRRFFRNRVAALRNAKAKDRLSHCDSDIIKIKFSEIPVFLHDGEFYKSLSEENEGDGEVNVPHRCYCHTSVVENVQDFERMLQVVAFWGLKDIPENLIKFCADNPIWLWTDIIGQMGSELSFAHELRRIFGHDRADALPVAIKWGKTEIVEFLVKYEAKTERGSIEAARCGRVDYLALLHHHGYPWDNCACAAAAEGGHLDCLTYLHETGSPWDYYVYINAAKYNSLPCIEYAYKNGLAWHVNVGIAIAKMKRFDTLIYAVQRGCPLHSEMTNYAAYEGHSECLQYLLYLDCPVEYAMHFACQEGRVESLRLLHEHGVSWDNNATITAAKYNQLECLQYLHENGCPWDESIPIDAAKSGRIEILRYSLDNGCPYGDDIMAGAAASRHATALDCVRYLTEEQGIYMGEQSGVFAAAFGNANIELVKYLLDIGCPYQHYSDDTTLHLKNYLFLRSRHLADDDSISFEVDLLTCVKLAVERGYNFTNDLLYLLWEEFPRCARYLGREGYI